jgi:leucyl/phenylalanyl-tRNA--protein transferase
MSTVQRICPEDLISAYSQGYFPMADEYDGKIYWHCPDYRAVMPFHDLKQPRSLRQFLKKNHISFKVNTNFEYVIYKCADRDSTWINREIIDVYINFHYLGFAHSVEAYIGNQIVGGLYGVSMGGAFFGESMFSELSNASKASFYYLIERLKERKFILLDSQYLNPFTESLGAIEIPKYTYMHILNRALKMPCKFA